MSLYTIIFAFVASALAVLLFTHYWRKQPLIAAAPSPGVEIITALSGIGAALVSIWFAASFAWTMGDTLIMKIAFVLVFLVAQGAEFTGAFHIARAWHQRRPFLFVLCLSSLTIGVLLSVLAGQSHVANRVDALEAQRIKASGQYQAAMSARDSASAKAARLAVSKTEADAAHAQLENARADLRNYLASNAKNSKGRTVGTVQSTISKYGCGGYYANLCTEQQRLQSDINAAQQIITRWNHYQGALQHAEALQSTPLESGVTDATLPWIDSLSKNTGITEETITARFNVAIAGVNEFLALLLLYLWGNMRMRDYPAAPQNIPAAQVQKTGEPVPQLDVGGRIIKDGLIHGHAGEIVLNETATSWLDTQYPNWLDSLNQGVLSIPIGNASYAMPKSNDSHAVSTGNKKKTVGITYTCCREDCDNSFKARTVWQKQCPQCREKREAPHRRRNKK